MRIGIFAAIATILLSATPVMADGMLGDPAAYVTQRLWAMPLQPGEGRPAFLASTSIDSGIQPQIAQTAAVQSIPRSSIPEAEFSGNSQ